MRAAGALAWLAAQPPGQRFYWADRGGRAVAGRGVAATRDLDPADPDLSAADGETWLGGLAFDPGAPPAPEWEPFGAGRLWLPRELYPSSAEAGEREPVIHSRERCFEGDISLPAAERVGHAPGLAGWEDEIEAALAAMAAGGLEKVVLARRTALRLARPVDPFHLLARLAQESGSTYCFAFEPRPGWAFLGCSPERLFRRQGGALWTEALAGTRPRGPDDARTAALAAELRASPKEANEHRLVVDAIDAAIRPLCESVERPEGPDVHLLTRLQHLCTRFRGALRPGVSDGALLAALHPTPAVCGHPAGAARAFLRAREPFARGWYAGAVGRVGPGGADFAVGIRSALLREDRLWLYAGAGVVPGSQPAAEWAEIDAKSAALLSLLEAA